MVERLAFYHTRPYEGKLPPGDLVGLCKGDSVLQRGIAPPLITLPTRDVSPYRTPQENKMTADLFVFDVKALAVFADLSALKEQSVTITSLSFKTLSVR